MKTVLAVAITALGFSASAMADYYATSPIEGTFCKGLVIEACKPHTIAAVKGDDGRLYTVQRRYTWVTDYSERTGRCHIKTKAGGGGLLSWAVNAAEQPVFYERTPSGQYKALNVEYVSFKCVKR